MSKIADLFKFRERNTSHEKEFIVSITTFTTMVYALIVQPGAIVGYGDVASIINANDVMITKEAIVITCAIINGLITLLMALYANLPPALVTGMGNNFMFGALIQSRQLSFGGVMAVTLISGVVFLLLTIFGVCDSIVKAIPKSIKISTGTVINFLIACLGFRNIGIAAFMENGMGVEDLIDPAIVLAALELVIIAILTTYKVNGTILIGIVIVTLLGIPARVITVSPTFTKIPDFTGLGNVMFDLDSKSIFSFSSAILILAAFYGDFFSTLGTILDVSAKAGILDENEDLPSVQQPFLVNATDICVGAPIGNTATTTSTEFSAGVGTGGRTGFTSVVVSVVFMTMVFLFPLVLMIPNAVTGLALIFVGFLMISGLKDVDFTDFTESSGPPVTIMFIMFTDSITSDTSAGILVFVLIKTAIDKFRKVHPIMYVMVISLICYLIYG